MNVARLIIDEPQSGSWNMAVDQALLKSANDFGQVTFRLYRWQPATVSLGYFQKLGDRDDHAASVASPIVRRASGGGAIVHDQEWTYSLTLPASNRLSSKHDTLVMDMHNVLVELLAEFGVAACLFQTGMPDQFAGQSPFLCFQRRAENDLLVGQHKVCGSAQRRTDGAILQHGSLLCGRSAAAPELPGIFDLVENAEESSFPKFSELTRESRFIERWLELVAGKLRIGFQPEKLGSDESVLASQIENQRFASKEWLGKR